MAAPVSIIIYDYIMLWMYWSIGYYIKCYYSEASNISFSFRPLNCVCAHFYLISESIKKYRIQQPMDAI